MTKKEPQKQPINENETPLKLLKLFSLPEAQKLLPAVEGLMAQGKKLMTQIKKLDQEKDGEKIAELAITVNKILDDLEELGCQCKGIETGLVDFPSVVNGEIVYLCWKYGETDINYWHRLEDGFKGRIKIDQKVHFSPYWKN
jgi:hypothetical protein